MIKYLILLMLVSGPLLASDPHHGHSTENTTTEPVLFTGLTDSDLADTMAASIAGGSHQFDYSTTRWQLSMSGVWEFGGEQANSFSAGVAKRFGEDSFLPNALFHSSYTPKGSEDWFQFGVLIVF